MKGGSLCIACPLLGVRLPALLAGLVPLLLAGALLSGASAGVNTPHSGWYSGNPLLGPNQLNDVACSGQTCYAAGSFGTLLKSTDAGCDLERDRDRPDRRAVARPARGRRAAARRDRRRLRATALRRRRRDLPPAAVQRERHLVSGSAAHLRLPDRGRRLPVPRRGRRPLHRRRRPDLHPPDGRARRSPTDVDCLGADTCLVDLRRHDPADGGRRRLVDPGSLRHACPQQHRRGRTRRRSTPSATA